MKVDTRDGSQSHDSVIDDVAQRYQTRRFIVRRGIFGVRECARVMPDERIMCLSLASERTHMKDTLRLLGTCAVALSCMSEEKGANSTRTSAFSITVEPFATVNLIGPDTLSDSARILELYPEPDGGSITFRFTDPVKHINSGLGIVQATGTRQAQLVWPDSVVSAWWAGPHELGFTAGTGTGVRIIVDVHATQLQAIEASDGKGRPTASKSLSTERSAKLAVERTQAFIDSIRVQPEGMPQRSAILQYKADTVTIAPDTLVAAVHVSAQDGTGKRSNPSWYLLHIPSGHVRPVDSLTGSSPGLPASAGQWSRTGMFYYAKERSIWQAQPRTQ